MICTLVVSGSGSSPRMRGAPDEKRHPACCDGIIPAYAGSTPVWTLWRMQSSDHPRVCGEHLVDESYLGDVVGSSPRMRGALSGQTSCP